MPLARSKLNIGWSSVTITPLPSGTATTLDEITNVSPSKSNAVKAFFGDAHLFATLILSRQLERHLTITTGNVFDATAIQENQPYTIVAIWNDAKNAASTGAITITLANAVCTKNGANGPANDFGVATLEFQAYSSDGSTDPLSVTQAAPV